MLVCDVFIIQPSKAFKSTRNSEFFLQVVSRKLG